MYCVLHWGSIVCVSGEQYGKKSEKPKNSGNTMEEEKNPNNTVFGKTPHKNYKKTKSEKYPKNLLAPWRYGMYPQPCSSSPSKQSCHPSHFNSFVIHLWLRHSYVSSVQPECHKIISKVRFF